MYLNNGDLVSPATVHYQHTYLTMTRVFVDEEELEKIYGVVAELSGR
jgi:hypothetical protein